MPAADSSAHLMRGTPAYRRATLALFCAGFATFALLYCVQPLLPLLAAHFSVSAAGSSLALSLTTLSLAVCLLVSGALAKRCDHLLWLRALLGLALSGLPALAMTHVGEAFGPAALAAAMGLYIGCTALGGLLGRLLAGLLSDLGRWLWCWPGLPAWVCWRSC